MSSDVRTSPDGETRTSRIVGSVDFHFPVASPSEEPAEIFKIVSGVRCQMPFKVKVASSAGIDEQGILETVSQVFDEVESTLSNWNPDSEVNVVNKMKVGDPAHKMSPMLREVVLASKEMVKLTKGNFDPSIAPLINYYHSRALFKSSSPAHENSKKNDESRIEREVINVWKELLKAGYSSNVMDTRISKRVKKLLELSSWSSAFSVHKEFISKKHDEACLDLSGIAKGYTVDEIARRLPSPCMVEWGGDIKVVGKHPLGKNVWSVGVRKPRTLFELQEGVKRVKEEGQQGPVYTLYSSDKDGKNESDEYLAIIDLKDGDAIATSGDCEKVIEKDGKLYSHIINPKLGRLLEINSETLAQAVVICKGSCMCADALSTAAISLEDPAKARELLEPFRTAFRYPANDFLLFSRDGPRIIRLQVPGLEPKEIREKRLQSHEPAKVIVLGSGLAGMSAAIAAADAGAKVILLEKEERTGGNSAKATSGINGWATETQAEQGVCDDERLFERDTHRSGLGGTTNPSLVRTLSIQSAPAVHWLMHRFNIPLKVLSQLGGHAAKRTHRAPPDEQGRPVPIGFFIMKTMRSVVEGEYSDKIEIRCGSKVIRLLSSDESDCKTVHGVEVEHNGNRYEEYGDSVVVCTGGFGCSQSPDGLMARFRSDLLGFATTNGNFAQGEGVSICEELGAELIDMDKVQLHPTGFINPKDPQNPTKILAPEAIRGSGGILVNSTGKRFVNELDLRSVVSKAILTHCDRYVSGTYTGPPFAYCILSKESQELFGFPTLGFYKDKMGLFEECQDISAVANLIGCKEEVLIETLRSYSNASKIGNCPQTNKNIFPADISPESTDLIVGRITPSIHYTMGGVNINPAGEVQHTLTGHFGRHRHIRNLYAAGECTGGVHGGNRLAGNSLLECCVFGRIAGERAATVKQPEKCMFPQAKIDGSETHWKPVVLREVRNTDAVFGKNTIEARFNLYGALQHSGLDVGQFVGLRGECDGETLQGYFSPITRPDDEGVIGILARKDEKGGPITKLLNHIRPGSVLYMCAMGGLRLRFEGNSIKYRGREIKRIGLLAGGTGIAPMIQIIRAFSDFVRKAGSKANGYKMNLVFAAEGEHDVSYMKVLSDVKQDFPTYFSYYIKLNNPPLGWTEGVGFIETRDIKARMFHPPEAHDLCVLCGPPVFERSMIKLLNKNGFEENQIFSFSTMDRVSAK